MILPNVTDFTQVLTGEITQACFRATLLPESMMAGHYYDFEVMQADPAMYPDGTTEDVNRRVMSVNCRGMGWLSGDYCIDDPQWNEWIKWAEGREYSVQQGGGKPTVWWADAYDRDDRHVGYYVAHQTKRLGDTINDIVTDWDLAHTELFSVDDKPHPKSWLENEGYRPLRIRITDIDQVDVRELSEDDVKKMGFDTVLSFLGHWSKKHDPQLRFWFDERVHCYLWYFSKKRAKQGEVMVGEWSELLAALKKRPAVRYQAWLLKFEAVKDAA